MTDVLQITLEKHFAGGTTIATDLRLDVARWPVTVLFGPSGSGKTTILRCLAGLEHPDTGLIRMGEQTWFDGSGQCDMPPQQRRVGMLFQDYALFPHLTVAGNILFGGQHLSGDDRHRRLKTLLEQFGLSGLEHRKPHALSGGEQQRVGLARALLPQPQLLLLDEPLSALDAPTREQLRGELRHHLASASIPTVLVTHDRAEALALGDQLVILHEGRVEQVGGVSEVFSRPASLTVARIVGTESVVAAVVLGTREGLADVCVGEVHLSAVNPEGVAGEVFACIRAETVILEEGAEQKSSARNRLPARVVSLTPDGPMFKIALDCGFPLTALITHQSVEELALVPGCSVTACIKAPSIRLVPREPHH